jgi:hypothetical protein
VRNLPNCLLPVLVVVLAGWLGLSPTADSLTRGAATVVVVRAVQAANCGSREACQVSPTCRAEAAPAAAGCAGEDGPCCQYLHLGGLLFFAVGRPTHGPELRLLGCVAPGDRPPVVRSLVPPVPPPIGDLPSRA